jgi:hypothetical protein
MEITQSHITGGPRSVEFTDSHISSKSKKVIIMEKVNIKRLPQIYIPQSYVIFASTTMGIDFLNGAASPGKISYIGVFRSK